MVTRSRTLPPEPRPQRAERPGEFPPLAPPAPPSHSPATGPRADPKVVWPGGWGAPRGQKASNKNTPPAR